MSFQVGDSVAVLDDTLVGTVTSICGNRISIASSDGFDYDFDEKELVKITPKNSLATNAFSGLSTSHIISEKEKSDKKVVKESTRHRQSPVLEVDLHIHQLVVSSRGMSNFEMLDIQLKTAKRHIDRAMQKGFQRIIFIHGVGEGVLKHELEYLFRRYDNIAYYDANFQTYGSGATEVYIYKK